MSELTLSAVNVLKSTGGSRPRPDGIDELDAKFFSASVQRHIYRQQNARRCRTRVQLLLDEPRSSRAALVVHIVLVVFILLSIVVVVLDSIDPGGNQTLVLLELICSVAFTIEVIFRLAVVDGLWPLITDVCLYIDIIAILPFVFDLVCVATGDFGPLPEFEGEPEPEVVPDNGLAVHTNPFDWLRVARLLRLFKLARHFEGSRVIVDTLKRSFYALLVPLLATPLAARLIAWLLTATMALHFGLAFFEMVIARHSGVTLLATLIAALIAVRLVALGAALFYPAASVRVYGLFLGAQEAALRPIAELRALGIGAVASTHATFIGPPLDEVQCVLVEGL